jgi:AraC-like DNA-binding protein
MILSLIIWAAILNGFLLGVLFIASRKRRSFANSLLGCFLLTFVLGALSDLLPVDAIGRYSLSGYFTLPEVKLLMPVVFFHFVLEKVGRSRSFAGLLKIHYVLAFALIALTPVNVMLSIIQGLTLLDLLGWKILEALHMGHQYYAFLFTLFIFITALTETRRYRNLIRDEYADMTLLQIRWLWQFIFSMAPVILLWGAELLRIILGGTGQSELTTYAYLFIALFIYLVSYKAFTQHTLFETPAGTPLPDHSGRPPSDTPGFSTGSGSKPDPEKCLGISKEMQEKVYYLNQDLTVHDLAREMDMSARIISDCVNRHFGKNFNEWVNNYRVDKALELLQEPENEHLSIEGIGMDSGFKSRSAMYTAFKRKLGKSPGHFRE